MDAQIWRPNKKCQFQSELDFKFFAVSAAGKSCTSRDVMILASFPDHFEWVWEWGYFEPHC